MSAILSAFILPVSAADNIFALGISEYWGTDVLIVITVFVLVLVLQRTPRRRNRSLKLDVEVHEQAQWSPRPSRRRSPRSDEGSPYSRKPTLQQVRTNKTIISMKDPWDMLEFIASQDECDVNGVNIATVLHRMAKHCKTTANDKLAEEIVSDERFHALVARIPAMSRAFGSQEVSNIVWGCSTLRHKDTQLIDTLCEQFVVTAGRFSCQELSITVWAMGNLAHNHSGFWQVAIQRSMELLSEFDSTQISMLAWAFASAKIKKPQLYQRLGDAARNLMYTFNPQGVAITLWAFASVGLSHDDMMERAAQHVMQMNPNSLSSRDVSNLAWACRQLKYQSTELFAFLKASPSSQECPPGIIRMLKAGEKAADMSPALEMQLEAPWQEARRRVSSRQYRD